MSADLRDRIAEAMHGCPLDELHPEDQKAWRATAQAALDALGLEQVGWRTFCDDTLQDWWWFDITDEPPPQYQSEPVYRLRGDQ